MAKKLEGKKKYILMAGILVAAMVFVGLFLHFMGSGGGAAEGETAYVETVTNLTGQGMSLGSVNRFSGVVESQETWSVVRNTEVEVEELYVEVGQEVEEGEPLFTYSTAKYEEDLQQAQIDLERMNNEYTSIQETIAQLEKEKKKASSSEQGSYTIQIKDQQLSLREKEIDIQMKEADIEKLQDNIENATVVSGLTGVVKSINNGNESMMGTGSDNSYITVMKVGDYRVKGTVSEQNIGQLTVGAPVLVRSRVDDTVWHGTISEINTESPESSNNNTFFYGDSSNRSSKYPFYVSLENSEGLMMGQHVYVELDYGQGVSPAPADGNSVEAAAEGASTDAAGGIWIDEYMIDQTDEEHPAVWKEVNGRLRKTEVTLGGRREELGQVQVLSGLEQQDSIAFPDGALTDGMKTVPMSEMN